MAKAATKRSALKVFRTPIGFHDAYVAAPSQKAALAAWGAKADLFQRGVAEVVTDAALTRAPLADPGTVIKVPRGSDAEHLAALPKAKATATKPKPRAKPKPRPSRDALDAAAAALAALEDEHRTERRDLDARAAALARERRALEARQTKAREKLAAVRDRAEAAYDKALAAWR